MDSSSDTIAALADDDILWNRAPATCHEEWLLRLCGQLMQREANVIRMLEHQQREQRQQQQRSPGKGRGKGGRRCPTPSLPPSEEATALPLETDTTCSDA